MIPQDSITAWRQHAPWPSDDQVEQDLILCRGLVDIFNDEQLKRALAFRGGTALHKLYLQPAPRYSEDIDLVQVQPGPIGPILSQLRVALGWLGKPKSDRGPSMATLTFSARAETPPNLALKVKIEINTREHFSVDGPQSRDFSVDSDWFSGAAKLNTFTLEELLATKVRALYQRKKGRDLFDLWWAEQQAKPDWDHVIDAFTRYMQHEGHTVSAAEFGKNLDEKLKDSGFRQDIVPLLRPSIMYDVEAAARHARDVVGRIKSFG